VSVPEPVKAAVEQMRPGFHGGVHALLCILLLRMMCTASDLRMWCTAVACGSGSGAPGDSDRARVLAAVAFERLIGEGASCSCGEGLGMYRGNAEPDRFSRGFRAYLPVTWQRHVK